MYLYEYETLPKLNLLQFINTQRYNLSLQSSVVIWKTNRVLQ